MRFKRLSGVLPAWGLVVVFAAVAAAEETWEPFWSGEGPGSLELEVLSSDLTGVVMEVRLSGMWVTEREEGGEVYQQLRMESAGRTADIGSPEIPYMGRWVGVPRGAQVSARVVVLDSMDLYGYQVWPSQEPMPDMEGVEPGPFQRDEVAYGGEYPDGLVRVSGTKVVRGCEVALVGVFPLRYDGEEGRIRVYRRMRVEVSFSGGAGYFVESRLRSRFFDPLYAGMLVNYGSFEGYEPLGAPRDDEGEMILLVPDGMAGAVQSFAQWRTMSGIPTVVTTLSQAGGDTAGIRQYIRDAYEQWETPPSFVILIGDHNMMPCRYDYGTGTDLWYFTVDGNDDFADIHHGRMSVEDGMELATILNRIMEYEKNPLPGAWNNHVFLAAYEEPGRFFTITSDAVYNYLITLGYDCDRAYQNGNPPGNTQDVINNWNQGSFIVNHRDHGDWDGWSHPSFTNSHLSQLTNGMMLPVVYSLNCLTGYFDSNSFECFCEELFRLNPGGCIGVVGATRTSYSGYNDELCKGLYDAMFPGFDPAYPGGGSGNPWGSPTFQQGTVLNFAKWWMYDKYVLTGGAGYPWTPDPYTTRLEYELFHYHGDPSQDIHSAEPAAMMVNHDAATVIGVPSFTVYADEEGALVTLSIDGGIVGREYVSGGVAEVVFDESPTQPGVMDVVVTAHNRIPYEGEVNIAPADGWYVVIDSVMIDDYWGHVDGMVEQGDSVGIELRLWNVGQQQAPSVTGVLSSADGAVSIAENTQVYGMIPPDGTATSPGEYLVAVAGGVSDGHIVPFQLAVTSGDSVWTRQFTMAVHAPVLSYVSYQVDDSGGNNNSRLDPGETAYLTVSVLNAGTGWATNVTSSLQSLDAYLQVNQGTSPYADFAPGASGDNQTVFEVYADPTTPGGQMAAVELTMSAHGPYTPVLAFTILIGQKPVLLVDDDDGESHEAVYAARLGAYGYSYDMWDVSAAGAPDLADLDVYRLVIWTTGDDHGTPGTLEDVDQTALRMYLDGGGSLWLSSEELIKDIGVNWFVQNYLHVTGYETDVGVTEVVGVVGDPVAGGLTMPLSYPTGLSNLSDDLQPGMGGVGALVSTAYTGSGGGPMNVCGVRYVGGYRVLYQSVPYEAFPPMAGTTYLKKAMEWLAPELFDVTPPGAVSDLAVGLVGGGVRLMWGQPWDNVGVVKYRVYRGDEVGFEVGVGSMVAEPTFPVYTDWGGAGDPGVNHYYVVTALDANGNESAVSNMVGEFDYETGDAAVAAPIDGPAVDPASEGSAR